MTDKRTRTDNYELSYLGYDDKAAEDDIIRLARKLSAGYEPTHRGRRLPFVTHPTVPPRRLKIVFVCDELDKLAEFLPPDQGSPFEAIEEILG